MPKGTYIYGVVQATRAPSLAGVPVGLSGAGRPRALRAGRDRWVVVADVPLEQYGEKALADGLQDLDWVASRAMAHEAVVEHLARRASVVPMKLFTIFLTDDRAIEDIERSAEDDRPRLPPDLRRRGVERSCIWRGRRSCGRAYGTAACAKAPGAGSAVGCGVSPAQEKSERRTPAPPRFARHGRHGRPSGARADRARVTRQAAGRGEAGARLASRRRLPRFRRSASEVSSRGQAPGSRVSSGGLHADADRALAGLSLHRDEPCTPPPRARLDRSPPLPRPRPPRHPTPPTSTSEAPWLACPPHAAHPPTVARLLEERDHTVLDLDRQPAQSRRHRHR